MSRMCGGLSEKKDSCEEIEKLCNEIKCLVVEKLNREIVIYEPLYYKQQIVAGMNYFIKIQIGDDEYIVIRLYKPLFDPMQLISVKTDVGLDDEIEYF
ncbi:cystatin-B-like [Argonauta hians]